MNKVTNLLDMLIEKALTAQASDVHIEPEPDKHRVRFRIDGLLVSEDSLLELGAQIIGRIKVLAHLNVAEPRLPQDGKFSFSFLNRTYDIRVATFPTVYGEKAVLRLLDRSSASRSLHELGLTDEMYTVLNQLAKASQGFFLVTGPTGSGKTTTLHALLTQLASAEKNIVTLEDPVEYSLQTITQTQIVPDIGFTFSKALRSLLRQDPDVIMVGEIRDPETAQTAVQAALTGHVILSTLHTADAPQALIRLIDMGVEPFLVAASLNAILAQRLARRLCTACIFQSSLSEDELKFCSRLQLLLTTHFKSAGCEACRFTGYKGRIGIFQLAVISQTIRSVLLRAPHYDELREKCVDEGMRSLVDDAQQKVETGVTSLAELARVL